MEAPEVRLARPLSTTRPRLDRWPSPMWGARSAGKTSGGFSLSTQGALSWAEGEEPQSEPLGALLVYSGRAVPGGGGGTPRLRSPCVARSPPDLETLIGDVYPRPRLDRRPSPPGGRPLCGFSWDALAAESGVSGAPEARWRGRSGGPHPAPGRRRGGQGLPSTLSALRTPFPLSVCRPLVGGVKELGGSARNPNPMEVRARVHLVASPSPPPDSGRGTWSRVSWIRGLRDHRPTAGP